MTQGLLGKIAKNVSGTSGTGKATDSGDTPSGKPGARAAGDTVQLTSSGRLLERLEKAFASMPEIDRGRVDAVKSAIESGNYRVDADRLAEAIIRSDLKLGN